MVEKKSISLLDQLLNFLIPNTLKKDEHKYQQAKIITYINILAVLLIISSLVAGQFVTHNAVVPYPLLFLVAIVQLVCFKKYGSIFYAGNVLALSFFILEGYLCFTSGGIYSLDLIFLIMVPVIAYLVVDKKSGIVWTLVIIAFYTIVFLATKQDPASYIESMAKYGMGYFFSGGLSLIIILSLTLLTYENQKTIYIERLQTAQKKLAQTNKLLEDKVKHRTAALESSNKELQNYVYITSHNLREPVANIKGFVELYNREEVDDPMNTIVIDSLDKASQNIDRIVKDLHHIISIKRATNQEKITINLIHLFEKIQQSLARQIKDTQAEINLNFTVAPTVVGIPSYIESIFMNLLSNALKYKHPDRTPIIQIQSFRDLNNYVCIAIKDNGLGIDLAKHSDQLFNLYTRFHNHVEGTGLGLYLVKSQTEAMNGKVEVKSQLNGGTAFVIKLPPHSNKQTNTSK